MKAKRIVIGVALGILWLAVISCSSTPTEHQPSVPIDLQLSFKPSLLTTLIDTVRLRITYPETDEIRNELPSLEQGIIRDTLVLSPGNDVEFFLSAISGEGQVLYEGDTTLNIVVGGSTVVTIKMEPVVSMLRPSPIYQLVSLNEEFSVGIDLYNITDLYGAAFRLYFNEDTLAVKSVEPGPFLGDNVLFTPNIQSGYVAVGISRLPPDMDGVDKSGRLATIVFEAVGVGASALEFDTDKLSLTDQAGQPIPEAANLVVETGRVLVTSINPPPD
jgi:hypothetical protein